MEYRDTGVVELDAQIRDCLRETSRRSGTPPPSAREEVGLCSSTEIWDTSAGIAFCMPDGSRREALWGLGEPPCPTEVSVWRRDIAEDPSSGTEPPASVS